MPCLGKDSTGFNDQDEPDRKTDVPDLQAGVADTVDWNRNHEWHAVRRSTQFDLVEAMHTDRTNLLP